MITLKKKEGKAINCVLIFNIKSKAFGKKKTFLKKILRQKRHSVKKTSKAIQKDVESRSKKG